MTVIGVHDAVSGVQLRSCPACGRHAWQRDGRRVDRSELLDTLRVVKEPGARRPARAPAAAAPAVPAVDDETSRREELQRLLARFSVHGTSS
jgi:hypothetical protein